MHAASRLHWSTAGSKAARTELVRILIAKDIFDGCEGATKAVYRALVAASRQWATEEQVTPVRQPAVLHSPHRPCTICSPSAALQPCHTGLWTIGPFVVGASACIVARYS